MGGARVTTLVTLRKCTLGHKREIKTLKFVSASTKGFKGGLAWIKPSKKDMAVTFSYSPGPLGPLGKPIHRPSKALVAAEDGEQRVQGLASPCAPDLGVVRLVLPGVRVEALVVWGGGVVGEEEGVGAVHHPVASSCVVVGGGEGFSADCT